MNAAAATPHAPAPSPATILPHRPYHVCDTCLAAGATLRGSNCTGCGDAIWTHLGCKAPGTYCAPLCCGCNALGAPAVAR